MQKDPEHFASLKQSLNPFPKTEDVFKLLNSEPPQAQAQRILLN
jgi:hypothetical protein